MYRLDIIPPIKLAIDLLKLMTLPYGCELNLEFVFVEGLVAH